MKDAFKQAQDDTVFAFNNFLNQGQKVEDWNYYIEYYLGIIMNPIYGLQWSFAKYRDTLKSYKYSSYLFE